MAKTLSTIRTAIRSNLDEPIQADWTNTEIDLRINSRYHRLYTAVVNTFEDYYMTTTTFNTVASQQEYTSAHGFPTDLYKMRRVEINYDTSQATNAPLRALPIPIDAVRRDLGMDNLGITIQRNPVYYLIGSTLGIIPVPDRSDANAIKLWYIRNTSDLSSDSSEIDIPYADRYWDIIANGATADLLRFGQQDMSAASEFEALAKQGLDKMQEELEDRVSEEAKFVLDVSGESFDFTGSQY